MLRFSLVTSLVLGAAGCIPKTGRLETNRYQHERYPYAIFYTPDGSPQNPLGGAWRVDNFSFESGSHDYALKQGTEYVGERRFDTDGNGTAESSVQTPNYDLLLEHTQKDATMWVRTLPVAEKDKDKELSAFADRYVASVSGTGQVAPAFGEGTVEGLEQRFASRVLHSAPCSVSKREAQRVDLEVANVDQLQLSAESRWQRASLVFVRTPYRYAVRQPAGTGVTEFPVLMVIGLTAKPEDFAGLEPDFHELLRRTVLGEVRKGLSMNGETTCSLDAPSTAAEASEGAPEVPLNEAAQIPLAPEAMPQPETSGPESAP